MHYILLIQPLWKCKTINLHQQLKPTHWKELNQQNSSLKQPACYDARKLGHTQLGDEVTYLLPGVSSDPGPPAGLPHLRPATVFHKSTGVGGCPPL